MRGDVNELGKRVFTIDDVNEKENDRNQAFVDEELFRQIYVYEPPPKTSLADKLRRIKCGREFLLDLFPILKWFPKYRKKDIVNDVIAGLTVAVMHIPQGMAYALLGGVPPVVGIYMAFFPVLIYIIMGTSRHVSMGTFAVVCMMVGKSVDTYTNIPITNSTSTVVNGEQFVPSYTTTEVATAVCLIVGIWQVVLMVFRLGSLSVLLSPTLVSGFTTGAAVHVLTSQIRNLLGIKVKRYSGSFKIIYSYVDIISNVSKLNPLAVILSASFISFLVIFNEVIKPWIQKKLGRTIPFPVELIVVIIGTFLSKYFNMKEVYKLAIVDYVPTGLPEPHIPPLHLLPNLLMDGLIIAIVAVSINISMATIFAQKLGYEIDGNQEILASGVGNIFSAFFSCMPFAASLSRSLIQESAGGKTQITSVVSSFTLAFVLLFMAHLFEPLPYCVLSTIIVVALKGMFKQIIDVPTIYKNSKLDGMVWIVTFVSVVVLDIDYGLGIGILASVASLILHSQGTKVVILGRVPNTQLYLDVNLYKKAQTLDNILIFQLTGGIHFANSNSLRKELLKLVQKFLSNLPVKSIQTEIQRQNLSVVLDLSCVSFIDPSGVKSLLMVYEDVKALYLNFLISGCSSSVYESLEKCKFFKYYPKNLVFHSLHESVEYGTRLNNRFPLTEQEENIISKF